MFEVGNKVRIKDSAFLDSSDRYDQLARGRSGVIVTDFGPMKEDDCWIGCYEVELDEPIDDIDTGIYPVVDSEIELVV